MSDLFLAGALGAICMFTVTGLILKPIYVEQGRIEVASGLAKCALKEQQDHSTSWECVSTKPKPAHQEDQ